MNRVPRTTLTACLTWAVLSLFGPVATPSMAAAPIESALIDNALVSSCGQPRVAALAPFDFRLRDTDGKARKGAENLEFYHVRHARSAISSAKPYAPHVMNNLDFALRHSRNHHDAISLLIRWELAGGDLLKYPTAACYLVWAQQFAPDDQYVYVAGGNYFWKSGNIPRARLWYQKALDIDPASAEAHYNFGLMLLELKEFDAARDHANSAYSGGYPLPGLRDKLMNAGYSLGSGSKSATSE